MKLAILSRRISDLETATYRPAADWLDTLPDEALEEILASFDRPGNDAGITKVFAKWRIHYLRTWFEAAPPEAVEELAQARPGAAREMVASKWKAWLIRQQKEIEAQAPAGPNPAGDGGHDD